MPFFANGQANHSLLQGRDEQKYAESTATHMFMKRA